MEGMTRRELVFGACGLVAMFALGAGTKALAFDDGLIRPPGGQDEALFKALCVKCDRCRSVCPRGCIETASVFDSFLDARTPVLDFHQGYCDFCNRCIDVCPTGALAAFDPQADKIGIAELDRSKCIAYTRGQCVVCQGSCPYGALTFSEAGLPSIDPKLCNGCGQCVMACNVNVNRSFDGSFKRAIEVHPVQEAQ